jgi:hypothetical protein
MHNGAGRGSLTKGSTPLSTWRAFSVKVTLLLNSQLSYCEAVFALPKKQNR